MSIVITSKKEAKRLGVPVGTIIPDSDAPKHLVMRKEAIEASEVSDSVVEHVEESVAWAKDVRERVAAGKMPF